MGHTDRARITNTATVIITTTTATTTVIIIATIPNLQCPASCRGSASYKQLRPLPTVANGQSCPSQVLSWQRWQAQS